MVGSSSGMPATIHLNNPEIAYDVWVLWRATGRRFLPSQLLAEPYGLLDDMLNLDGLYRTVTDNAEGSDDQ